MKHISVDINTFLISPYGPYFVATWKCWLSKLNLDPFE